MALRKVEQYLGTGRRKRGIARVFLRPGSGKITINGREFENYFPTEAGRAPVRQALATVEMADRFDILILAHGGGVAGQAGAIVWVSPALWWNSTPNCAAPEESGSFDTRSPPTRAQEVRPKGRPRPVPVLQALKSFSLWPGCRYFARAHGSFDSCARFYVVAARLSSARKSRLGRAQAIFGLLIKELVCLQFQ